MIDEVILITKFVSVDRKMDCGKVNNTLLSWYKELQHKKRDDFTNSVCSFTPLSDPVRIKLAQLTDRFELNRGLYRRTLLELTRVN